MPLARGEVGVQLKETEVLMDSEMENDVRFYLILSIWVD